MSLVRLNKALSEAGVTSRRKADRLIEMGLVQVNGKKVFEMGIKVNPRKDRIVVDGHPVTFSSQKVYLMLHKPKNVMTTLSDPEGRPIVMDYFKKFPLRIFPIGRLDWESEGLLLLTNDGDFANKVMHPKKEITKTYWVKVSGQPQKEELQKLIEGVTIPTGKARALIVERLRRPEASDQYDWIKVVIAEGKNRQIREMFLKIGYDVLKLQRVAIGRLRLGALPKGEWTELTEEQVERVFESDKTAEEEIRRLRSIQENGKKNQGSPGSGSKEKSSTGSRRKSQTARGKSQASLRNRKSETQPKKSLDLDRL
jgi:23S rRNA pseudouridine2605 synthase